MRSLTAITPLLRRVIVFLCLFIIISGAIGPRIVSGGILFKDGFWIYSSIGKSLIFGLIVFLLLARRNKTKVALASWRPALLSWNVAMVLAFSLSWLGVNNLLAGQSELPNLLMAHGGLLLCIIFALLGSIGPKNVSLLSRNYWREMIGASVLAVVFSLFLVIVYSLWRPLASVVLHSVNGLLGATGLHAIILPPYTLMLDKFGITVAQYCSGIESIALFTSLYLLVGLLDWSRINKRRYYTIFPFALLVLCALNIVRVYGLILAGYYINPELAFSLFHTYAGMVFFILYSVVFWAVAYKYLLNRPQAEEEL